MASIADPPVSVSRSELSKALNPIACEHCRAKKCKCDRTLPYCSQCQAASLTCRYTEGGKRGIPAAYMNSLEDRLAETEAALYSALKAIDAMDHGGSHRIDQLRVADRMSKIQERSKAERRDEWKRLPLRSGEQLQNWYEQKKSSTESQDQPRLSLHISPVNTHPHLVQVQQPESVEFRQQPQDANQTERVVRDAVIPGPVLDPVTSNQNTQIPAAFQLQASVQWRNYF